MQSSSDLLRHAERCGQGVYGPSRVRKHGELSDLQVGTDEGDVIFSELVSSAIRAHRKISHLASSEVFLSHLARADFLLRQGDLV